MNRLTRLAMAFAVALLVAAGPSLAADFPAPQGDVLLTITGAQDGDTIALDRTALDSLPRHTYETATIWTDGVKRFEGVSMAALLDRLGVTQGTVRLTAANDYSVEVPVADLIADDPIIADRVDGAAMSLREKGPLWVIYPYDRDTRFQNEIIFARSIWQLERLEVGN